MQETLDHDLQTRDSSAEVTAVALEVGWLHFSTTGYSNRDQQPNGQSANRNTGRACSSAEKTAGRGCPMKN